MDRYPQAESPLFLSGAEVRSVGVTEWIGVTERKGGVMITDELAHNREQWLQRAETLRSLAQVCRQIEGWDSPTGQLLEDRLTSCAESIEGLAEKADKLSEAYDLHLQVVSVGGRIQL